MDKNTKQHFDGLHSYDTQARQASFEHLMAQTRQPVSWADEAWPMLVALLNDKSGNKRLMAGQLLCALAKSDSNNRMQADIGRIFNATYNEKPAIARAILQSVWKIGVHPASLEITLKKLEERYKQTSEGKKGEPMRYDIIIALRKIHDATAEISVSTLARKLIALEGDPKYQKKYLHEWKDAFNTVESWM